MTNVQRIENIIKQNDVVTAFDIHSTVKTSCELYYILDKLETAREVDIDEAKVTIYKDIDGLRTSSSFNASSSLTDEEIKEKTKEALQRCKYSKSKHFELPKNDNIDIKEYKSNIQKDKLKEQALKVSEAVFKANVYKEGWINSTEIFLSVTEHEFVNSQNVRVTYPTYNLFIEVIPTWKGISEEVELYLSLSSSYIDYDKVTVEVNNKLLDAKKRGKAQNNLNLSKANVILGTSETAAICKLFASNFEYGKVYRNMNRYKTGEEIQQGTKCDKLNITGIPYLERSSLSAPIDEYGTRLKETKIIKDGKGINLWGNVKDASYLDIEKPTGYFRNIKVETGSIGKKEMFEKPYLLITNFSSFQLDIFSGFFGGEVRLGVYFDGEKEVPVTGFSVAGNIYEAINQMHFSVEKDSLDGYFGPKYSIVEMNINK